MSLQALLGNIKPNIVQKSEAVKEELYDNTLNNMATSEARDIEINNNNKEAFTVEDFKLTIKFDVKTLLIILIALMVFSMIMMITMMRKINLIEMKLDYMRPNLN